jgi:hypothetical protein
MPDKALLSSNDTIAFKFAAASAAVCVAVMVGLAFIANLIG